MAGTLSLIWDTYTRELRFGRTRMAGNFAKRGETLTLSVTALDNDVAGTLPDNAICTIKPVNTYNVPLVRWTGFTQVGSTNVWTASTTLNSAEITALLGVVETQANCVTDFAGDGGAASNTLAIVLENNVTRDDDTAPTVSINRNDFLVTKGTGLHVNVALGVLSTGASVAAQSAIAVTGSATNYVELNSSGVASANTSGFTDGYSPLALVVTSSSAVTSITDRRPWIDTKGGGGGGSALVIKDEGSIISSAAASLNFTGAGVTATNTGGNNITIDIPSAGAGAVLRSTTTGTHSYYVAAADTDTDRGDAIIAARAEASAGDLLTVGPGNYLVAQDLSLDGVNWYLQEGCRIYRTLADVTTDFGGIFNDQGNQMAFTVGGAGVLELYADVLDFDVSPATVGAFNASSVLSIKARDIIVHGNASQSVNLDNTYTSAVWGNAYLAVSAERIIGYNCVGAWWQNGEMHVDCNELLGDKATLWLQCDVTPAGDCFVNCNHMYNPGGGAGAWGILGNGTNSVAAAWIVAGVINSSVPIYGLTPCANRIYVRAQKVFGFVDVVGGNFWVTLDKLAQNPTYSQIALITVEAGQRLSMSVMEVDLTSKILILNRGATTLSVGTTIGSSNATGVWPALVVQENGTLNLHDSSFTSSGNTTLDAIKVTGGTLNLRECAVRSDASRKDIVRTSGTATVTGGSGSGTNGVFTTTGTIAYTNVPVAALNNGASASSSTFWRGDGTWAAATGGVTSITGTTGEITVTGTTTPTLSIPSAVTFTGKTITGGTYASPTLTTPSIGVATATSINSLVLSRGGNTSEALSVAIGLNALAATNGSASANTAVGYAAGNSITSGTSNVAIGSSALAALTTNSSNVAIGSNALNAVVTGASNTSIGANSLALTTGTGSVGLGFSAGKYELGSNSLYVDNQDRSDNTGDKAKAIIYGTFASTAASQQLTFNVGTISAPGAAATFSSVTSGASTFTDANSAGASGVSVKPAASGSIGGTLTLYHISNPAKYARIRTGTMAAAYDVYLPTSNGDQTLAQITEGQTFAGNQGFSGTITQTVTARSTGVASYFTITPPADTGLTASTESIGVNLVTATRTWADGTVALQRERYFAGPTYNKTTTSATFTDVFNTYLDSPTAGTGVTFTRKHTLGIVDSTSATSSITGGLIVATTVGTAATSVGIGGGNIFAGGNITASDGSLGGTFTAGTYTSLSNNVLKTSHTAFSIQGVTANTVTFCNQANTANISFATTVHNTSSGAYLTASCVNTSACALTATASGSNVDIQLIPKGTGGVVVGTGTAIKNIRHGVSGAMTAGVVTVTDTGCTTNTRYFFTTHTIGTVSIPSTYYASTRTASTSFVITSNQITDTSTVDWIAIEP